MAVSLLSTKLHIPQLRQNAILRPRLTSKLLSSLEQPGSFGLLSGPAGFGKTRLLTEFVSMCGKSVAYFTSYPVRHFTLYPKRDFITS
jgi:LuxR family maltose regulon positive regulatory protein